MVYIIRVRNLALLGGSGTLGSAVITELLSRKEPFFLSALLLPSDWNKPSIRALAKHYNLKLQPPKIARSEFQIIEVPGLRIVWGDARNREAIRAVISGADWVVNAMALISPAADTQPDLARQVNDEAVQTVIDIICEEPNGAERVGYIHAGSVAQTGSRPPGHHLGRVGDPMNPSLFDHYALTKIEGERRVMESPLQKWVSLRISFIMPTTSSAFFKLFDPIMFHMPPDTRMESVTDRDAAFAVVQCMEQPPESSFWRRAYNIGGGPDMRSVAIEYLEDVFSQLGLDWKRCTKRNWYALKNFHLQFYADSKIANDYLSFWRDDLDTLRDSLRKSLKWHHRLFRWLNLHFSPFRTLSHFFTSRALGNLAETHPNSPRYWYLQNMETRIQAFFESRDKYESIGDWDDTPVINIDHNHPVQLFQHGVLEHKPVYFTDEVITAAIFRGGFCEVPVAPVQAHEAINWICAFGHSFTLKLNTVLHGGHWCPECTRSDNQDLRAQVDRFFGQAWYAALGKGDSIL